MGYCADRRYMFLAFIIIIFLVYVDGKSPPRTKSFDIWDLAVKKPQVHDSLRDDTITVTNDGLLHDYSEKTSLRSGKVLNFFPVLSEDECKTEDGRRSGICMNVYDCHRKSGSSRGQCALGFGVCCVFTTSCGHEIKNNITYIVSPNFPALMPLDVKSCTIKIKMMSPDISQLRFDFVHFSMGQPNRQTGSCDGDNFSILGGINGDFKLCGQNNGQHIYYDLISGKGRDDEAVKDVEVLMNFTSTLSPSRFWEIRVTQIPFSQRAPAGCLQYFTGNEGLIQTFNFAENGRHLANQNYRACIRQERGMCSIAYEPCNEQSFRIGHTQMLYMNAHAPNQIDPSQNQIFGPNGGGYSPTNNLNGPYAPNGIYPLNNANGVYQPGSLNGAYPSGSVNGAYLPGSANGAYPPGSANGAYPLGSVNGAYPLGSVNGAYSPGSVNGVYPPNNGIMNINPGLPDTGAISANGIPITLNSVPQTGTPGSLNALNPNSPTAQSGAGGSPVAGPSGAANDLPTSATNQTVQYDQFGNQINGTMEITGNMTMPAINMTDIILNATETTTSITTTSTTPVPLNDDEVEGSGDDGEEDEETGYSSLLSIGSFLTRAALFRSARSMENNRTPRQFFSFCTDRITMPCIVEDFISTGMGSVGTCSPVHCGRSLCPPNVTPCRVESTVTPFGLGFHFGDGSNKGSPEDNIGACLRFNQLSCA